MLLLEREAHRWENHDFRELPELLRGDELLVVNNTRVLPARLFGRRAGVHAEPVGKHGQERAKYLKAEIEVLLSRETSPGVWQVLVRPGRKIRIGERILFGGGEMEAEVIGRGELGEREIRFITKGDIDGLIEKLGHMPLPRYLHRSDEAADRERYQTIFAKQRGAVAAPTAALHFTAEVMDRLKARSIDTCEITLHVGLGTFQPIHAQNIEEHRMHPEAYEVSDAAAAKIEQAKREGRQILAVGTTVVRALEDAAQKQATRGGRTGVIGAGSGEAELFIRPGYEFRVVDQILTNFHLPKSSLLVMVSAFAGRDLILASYRHAIDTGYRFYSYGDCMLIR